MATLSIFLFRGRYTLYSWSHPGQSHGISAGERKTRTCVSKKLFCLKDASEFMFTSHITRILSVLFSFTQYNIDRIMLSKRRNSNKRRTFHVSG